MPRIAIFREPRTFKSHMSLTAKGGVRFEQARQRLARLAKRNWASDGDTAEYLSRGHDETVAYLKALK